MKKRSKQIFLTMAGLHNTHAGVALHLGLLHIEKGIHDAVGGTGSEFGKVHNCFEIDSCFAAVGNHERMDPADSHGSNPELEAAAHSLNPVRARRVGRETGCCRCHADTALAQKGLARIQAAHTQTQALPGDCCHQKLENALSRRLEYHPYHR